MKTIKIKAYEFKELSEEAKEKAREWYRTINCDDNFWSESVIEEAVTQGNLMGIDFEKSKGRGVCIWWSGFCSQGDGACFEGSWSASDVQADKVADGWGDDPSTTEIKRIAQEFQGIAKRFPYCSFTVSHRGHYNHEYCTEFDFSSGVDDMNEEKLEKWKSNDDDSTDPTENEDWESVVQLWKDRAEEEFNGVEDALKEAARDYMRWIYRQLEKEYDYRNSDECVDEDITANEYLFTEEGRRSTYL